MGFSGISQDQGTFTKHDTMFTNPLTIPVNGNLTHHHIKQGDFSTHNAQ